MKGGIKYKLLILISGGAFVLPLFSVVSRAEERVEMKLIPAGSYRPFFKEAPALQKPLQPGAAAPSPIPSPSQAVPQAVTVPEFRMDVHPVTVAQYERFVRERPEWRRSRAKAIFVDTHYLEDWRSDTQGPARRDPRSPVTFVSWFAARAYCAAQGKTLPTIAQWEYVADNQDKDADKITRRILDWYARPSGKPPGAVGRGSANRYGIHDLYDLVWEWNLDFGGAMMATESRASTEEKNELFCGSGSLGSRDPGDYARFMRYGFRSSLKADYSTGNLGFRCVKEEVK